MKASQLSKETAIKLINKIMKKIFGILMLVALFAIIGCTENQRAKNWGGDMELILEPNQKLVNITWKEADMWVLTRPMTDSDSAEIYKFSENSDYGVMEGTITIVENKTN
jgi:hypothetical protein